VIVMTAGELQQKREAEVTDWQKRGSRGVLAAVDPSANQITMTERTPAGPKTVTVVANSSTQFTRFAPNSVKFADAKPSSISELRPGDQLRVLGNASGDGSKITAERVISGAFETIPVTIVSVSPDGKLIQATNIQTKQPVSVILTADSSVRQMPPMLAAMLARRMNGASPPGAPTGAQSGPGPNKAPADGNGGMRGPSLAGNDNGGSAARWPAAGGGANGDISQMLERLPKVPLSDLKPGEQVVISGGVGDDKTHLTAINIIAGVEPLFAAPRQGQGGGRRGGGGVDLSNWNLDIGTPGEQ
jgi:hypothetical protein